MSTLVPYKGLQILDPEPTGVGGIGLNANWRYIGDQLQSGSYSGFSGYSGYSGISGYSGYSGRSGYSGYSGIRGADGISGATGADGASGFSGLAGTNGIDGTSGFSGYSGTIGLSGYSGYSGVSGYSGYSGTSGYSGYSGKSGYSGLSGYSGYSGFSGVSGYSGYSGVSGISGYSGYSGTSGYSGYSGTAPSNVALKNASNTFTVEPQIINPASATGANILDLQVNSVSKVAVVDDGQINLTNGIVYNPTADSTGVVAHTFKSNFASTNAAMATNFMIKNQSNIIHSIASRDANFVDVYWPIYTRIFAGVHGSESGTGRLDFYYTNLFFQGDGTGTGGTAVFAGFFKMSRTGDATSITNQFASGTIDFETAIWTGSANDYADYYIQTKVYSGQSNKYYLSFAPRTLAGAPDTLSLQSVNWRTNTKSGNVGINNTDPAGHLDIVEDDSTRVMLQMKAAASQSGDIVNIKNSSAAVLTKIDSAGNLSSTTISGPVSTSATTVTANTASSTTAQNLMTCNIAAGGLNTAAKTVKVFGAGTFNIRTTATITIGVKLGSTILASWTTSSISATTLGGFNFELYVTTQTTGSSGAVEAHGNLVWKSSSGSGAANVYIDGNAATLTSIDLTVLNALQVTVTFSANGSAGTLNDCTQRQLCASYL